MSTTYIKHTPRGQLIAIFQQAEHNRHELTITNPKKTFSHSKRLANRATSVNFQKVFKDMGWKAQE